MKSWIRRTFPKLPHKYRVYDVVQQTIVYSIVYILTNASIRYAVEMRHHFKVRRPILAEKRRIIKEFEFEKRQAMREFELQSHDDLQKAVDETKV